MGIDVGLIGCVEQMFFKMDSDDCKDTEDKE